MPEYIECRSCDSMYCDGCNNYILSKMLHNGKFNCIMDDHHTIKPAADVAEVRHGEWIDTNKFDSHYTPIYQCSECWKEVADNYIKYHKYCLHCGAKMDGKVE